MFLLKTRWAPWWRLIENKECSHAREDEEGRETRPEDRQGPSQARSQAPFEMRVLQEEVGFYRLFQSNRLRSFGGGFFISNPRRHGFPININNKPYYDMTPKSIYTFYYLSKALHEKRARPYLLYPYLSDMAYRYLEIFTPIIRNQLKKYIRLHRVDVGADLSNVDSADIDGLLEMVKRTFRTPKPGESLTRNVNWEALANHLKVIYSVLKEKDVDNAQRLAFLIDRVNNTIHNTGEIMLMKLPNGRELKSAFDYASSADMRGLYGKADTAIIDKLVDDKSDFEIDGDMSVFDHIRSGLIRKESLCFDKLYHSIVG